MKKVTILLIAIWLGLGCGTIKKIFNKDPEGHAPLPPDISEVQVDGDGNPIFSEDQLNGKESFNWGFAFVGVGFLITTALLIRRAVKND